MSGQLPIEAHQPPPLLADQLHHSNPAENSNYFSSSTTGNDNLFPSMDLAPPSMNLLGPTPSSLVPSGIQISEKTSELINQSSIQDHFTQTRQHTSTFSTKEDVNPVGFFDSLSNQEMKSNTPLLQQQVPPLTTAFQSQSQDHNAPAPSMDPLLSKSNNTPSSSADQLFTLSNPPSQTTANLFGSSSSTQQSDFLCSLQLQSLPVLPSQGQVGEPRSNLTHKPTSAPSTGLVSIIPSEQLAVQQWMSETDSSSSGLPSSTTTEVFNNLTNHIPPDSLLMSDRSVSSNTEPAVNKENPALSSPMSRPPSNADNHSRISAYAEPFNYQKTNADCESNLRGVHKGPLTNLESDPRRLSGSAPCVSGGSNILDKPADKMDDNNDFNHVDSIERPPSCSSSLNQSLCSLLDSQEDFTSQASPIRLVAPSPLVLDPHSQVGPPAFLVGEVPLEKLSRLSLLPPAPLLSASSCTVTTTSLLVQNSSIYSSSSSNFSISTIQQDPAISDTTSSEASVSNFHPPTEKIHPPATVLGDGSSGVTEPATALGGYEGARVEGTVVESCGGGSICQDSLQVVENVSELQTPATTSWNLVYQPLASSAAVSSEPIPSTTATSATMFAPSGPQLHTVSMPFQPPENTSVQLQQQTFTSVSKPMLHDHTVPSNNFVMSSSVHTPLASNLDVRSGSSNITDLPPGPSTATHLPQSVVLRSIESKNIPVSFDSTSSTQNITTSESNSQATLVGSSLSRTAETNLSMNTQQRAIASSSLVPVQTHQSVYVPSTLHSPLQNPLPYQAGQEPVMQDSTPSQHKQIANTMLPAGTYADATGVIKLDSSKKPVSPDSKDTAGIANVDWATNQTASTNSQLLPPQPVNHVPIQVPAPPQTLPQYTSEEHPAQSITDPPHLSIAAVTAISTPAVTAMSTAVPTTTAESELLAGPKGEPVSATKSSVNNQPQPQVYSNLAFQGEGDSKPVEKTGTDQTPAPSHSEVVQSQYDDERHNHPEYPPESRYHPHHDDYDPYYRDREYAYDDHHRYRPAYPEYPPPPPHGRGAYGYQHHYRVPPEIERRHHYPPYNHPGRPGYDYPYPPYGDPYHRRPYPYDAYEYSHDVHNPYSHHRYPHDPHYNYPPPGPHPPPPMSHPPYNIPGGSHGYPYSEDFYDGGEMYPPHESEGYHTQSNDQTSDVDIGTDPSIIDGPGSQNFVEYSQIYDSPNTRMPAYPQVAPLESTHMEHPQAIPPSHSQEGEFPVPHYYYPDGVYDDYNPNVSGYSEEYSHEGDAVGEGGGMVIAEPVRETPEVFSCPHVRVTFGFGGQLVMVLPSTKESAMVEISLLKDVLMDEDSREFINAVEESSCPLIPGETPKSLVVGFTSNRIQKCQEKKEAICSDEDVVPSENDKLSEQLEDEILLWEFLMLLCQQNGVIVPSDVADLLMRNRSPVVKSSTNAVGTQDQQESLDCLRQLLFSGRKKDALDFACAKSLWGHALMLASRMDEQSRTYVVNRFTASLKTTDALSTFYTLLLGRTPSAVKPEGLSRAGDWRPHLTMILANKSTKLDIASIVSLGDSLMAKERLHAAHLCYYLADEHFGSYGDTENRYSLLGIDHSELKVGSYPQPRDLERMEVLEYAMSLAKHDFALPAFQVFKLLHTLRLVEYGLIRVALKYCEQISYTVMKGLHKYVPTFLTNLVDISIRLHHLITDFGIVETELPSWLSRLQLSVKDILASDYTPSLLTPSPAFSSVSQTYSSSGVQHQLIIGLQLQQNDPMHLTVPHISVPPQLKNGDDAMAGSTEGYTEDNGTQNEDTLRGPKYYSDPSDIQTAASGNQRTEPYMPAPPSAHEVISQEGQQTFQQLNVGGVDKNQNQLFNPEVEMNGQLEGVGYYHQQPVAQEAQQQFPQFSTGSGIVDQTSQAEGYNHQYAAFQLPTSTEADPSGPPSQQSEHFIATSQERDAGVSGGMGYYGQQQPAHATTASAQVNYPNMNYGGQPSQSEHLSAGTTGLPDSTVVPPPATDQVQTDTKTNNEGSDDSQDQKPNENDKKATSESKKGGGWGVMDFFKSIVPKKKNQVHLPDDKNPSIVWDEKKKKWVNMDNDGEEDEDLPPPPKDSELKRSVPHNTAPVTTEFVDGTLNAAGTKLPETVENKPTTSTGGPPNMYSIQGLKRGRLGARSKYIDVLNPGGKTSSDGSGPVPVPPPGPPPPPMAGLPNTTSQPPPTTFFVPPPVEGDAAPLSDFESLTNTTSVTEASATTHSNPTPSSLQQSDPPKYPQQQDSIPHYTDNQQSQSDQQPNAVNANANTLKHEAAPQVQHLQSAQEQSYQLQYQQQQQQQQQQQYYGGSQENLPVSQGMPTQQTHGSMNQQIQMSSRDLQPNKVPVPSQQSTGQEMSMGASEDQPVQHPQFFNPSAFAPVGGYPGSSETPQDDAMSTVSLMSESSQEVSRYMNKTGTSSAGYNRLRQGIRGTKGYSSMQAGVANQQRPHPGQVSTAPPLRHS